MVELLEESYKYIFTIGALEALGLIFGLLCVYYLIKNSVLTWPTGITYIFISFVIFWQQQLYGDFLLHIIFLILNIYGWYHWVYGKTKNDKPIKIEWLSFRLNIFYSLIGIVSFVIFGYFLSNVHNIWPNLEPASVPYWDAATTALSVVGMWLTARKKVENWFYWGIVDILAVGIYIYKGIYFYALLYFIYIGLAIAGFIKWRKLARELR